MPSKKQKTPRAPALSSKTTPSSIRSMTGFAQSHANVQGLSFYLEAKSLNHRYCEVSYRGPRELSGLEPLVVQRVQKEVSRGRIEVTLSLKGHEARSPVKFNVGRAKALCVELENLRKRLGIKGKAELQHLIAFRDSFVDDAPVEVSSDIWPKLQGAFDALLERLQSMRAQEGLSIEKDLALRLGILKKLRVKMIEETDKVQELLHGVAEGVFAHGVKVIKS